MLKVARQLTFWLSYLGPENIFTSRNISISGKNALSSHQATSLDLQRNHDGLCRKRRFQLEGGQLWTTIYTDPNHRSNCAPTGSPESKEYLLAWREAREEFPGVHNPSSHILTKRRRTARARVLPNTNRTPNEATRSFAAAKNLT